LKFYANLNKLSLKAATHTHTQTGLGHKQSRHLTVHIYDVNDKTKWTSGRQKGARKRETERVFGAMEFWLFAF